MKQFWSFVLKEAKEISRDRRAMLILFGMPIAMMLIFGFAIRTDVKDVRVIQVTSSVDHMTRKIMDRLGASEYFVMDKSVGTPAEAEKMIRSQDAEMAIVFSDGFANHHKDGTASIQLMVDASDPNMAKQYLSYAQSIITDAVSAQQASLPINIQMLYNPQMKSSYNFVPGTIGMLILIICAMMTSISIVREYEKGTMEVLLVSPVHPLTIVIAKTIPYLVLSFVILTIILLMSFFVLNVPLAGSLFWIFVISLIYIILALSLGMLFSTMATTQVEALLMSAMVSLTPTMLMSGMIFPIESMPRILQYISFIIPARWFISAIRKLMIMGVGVTYVWKEVVIMLGMAVVLLSVSILKFKKRL